MSGSTPVSMSITVPFSNMSPRLINILVGGIVSGEVGYRAYGDAVGWLNYQGLPMPEWSDLPERIRSAWDRAAYAVVDAAAAYTSSSDPGKVCACGHSTLTHDAMEADGSGSRCCVDGCACGECR